MIFPSFNVLWGSTFRTNDEPLPTLERVCCLFGRLKNLLLFDIRALRGTYFLNNVRRSW